jgi:hypothetical protein
LIATQALELGFKPFIPDSPSKLKSQLGPYGRDRVELPLPLRGYGRQILALAAIILAVGLFGAALLNPELADGNRKLLHTCIVPVQVVKLEPLEKSKSLTSFSILYYECPNGLCKHNVSEIRIPPQGGKVELGPSILQNILAYVGNQALPATVLEAFRPGVLRASWSYPILKAGALLVVESNKALLLVEKNVSDKVKLVNVEGCRVVNSTVRSTYKVYSLKCSYNIAAKNSVRVELVQDRLHGLLLHLNPAQALYCKAYAQPIFYLKLPFLLATTVALAAAAALLYRQP